MSEQRERAPRGRETGRERRPRDPIFAPLKASRPGPSVVWPYGIEAHTSPVYVRVPGQELFSASAAAYMLTLIDGAQTWAATLATRPDTERLTRVLRVFADARDQLHRRLHEHGVRH